MAEIHDTTGRFTPCRFEDLTPKQRKLIKDLTGETFGRLTVEGILGLWVSPNGRRDYRWECRCECGNIRSVLGTSLKTGHTSSCGCLMREVVGSNRRRSIPRTAPEYGNWRAMVERCSRPKHKNWDLYGGRGISVCSRWRDGEGGKSGFECFYEDMGPRPFERATVERNDTDGDYCPSNCRWATQREQARNTRSNRLLTFRGETLLLSDWARRLGMTPGVLTQRLNKRGLSVEQALTEPYKRWYRRSRKSSLESSPPHST